MEHNDWIDIDVLEDYLNGKLDAKTMHQVERMSLEDPFVAEALAGLAISKNRNLNLSILQKQLKERIAQKPVALKRWRLTAHRLSIAATAAVLFIAVSLFFFMRENKRLKQVELANNSPKKVDVVVAQKATEINKNEPINNTKTNLDKALTAIKPTTIAQNKAKLNTKLSQQTAVASINEIGKANVVQMKAAPTATEVIGSASINKNQSFAMVLPSKAANVKMPSKTVLDKNVIKGKANALPGTSDMLILAKNNGGDTLSNVNSSLANATSGNLNEQGSFKKEGSGSAVYASTTPVNGWSDFQNYIQNNNRLNYPPVGKTTTLTFKVNSNGRPTAIKVIESAGEVYDNEAIRLLKNGGKWTYSSVGTNRTNIKVSF